VLFTTTYCFDTEQPFYFVIPVLFCTSCIVTCCGVCCYCNTIECMYAYAELCNYHFLYWCACVDGQWM